MAAVVTGSRQDLNCVYLGIIQMCALLKEELETPTLTPEFTKLLMFRFLKSRFMVFIFQMRLSVIEHVSQSCDFRMSYPSPVTQILNVRSNGYVQAFVLDG